MQNVYKKPLKIIEYLMCLNIIVINLKRKQILGIKKVNFQHDDIRDKVCAIRFVYVLPSTNNN